MNKKISIVENLDKVKSDIDKKVNKENIRPHLIIGIEIDEQGHPRNVINYAKANSIDGIGMIEFLQTIIDGHKEHLISNFKRLLKAPVHQNKSVPDPTIYHDLMNLIKKNSQLILSAIDRQDSKALEAFKIQILKKLSEKKGYPVQIDIQFGELLERVKKDEDRGFNLNRGFINLQ